MNHSAVKTITKLLNVFIFDMKWNISAISWIKKERKKDVDFDFIL